jgi:hypothetical protein
MAASSALYSAVTAPNAACASAAARASLSPPTASVMAATSSSGAMLMPTPL